jgi:cytochrome P450
LSAVQRHPPGPSGLPLLGCAPDMLRDPLGFLQQVERDHAELASFRLGPQRVYFATGPSALEQLLSSEVKRFFSRDRSALRAGQSFLGGGMLFLDGERWTRARRMTSPAFHKGQLAQYAVEMRAYTEKMLAGWRDGEVRDVHDEMMHLMVCIVSKTLLGAELVEEVASIRDAMKQTLEAFAQRALSPIQFPDWLPTTANLHMRRGVRALDAIILPLIRARLRDGRDHGDLLSRLTLARDADGSAFGVAEIRNQLVTFFMAGHETTALVLMWTLFLLASHGQIQQQLHLELEQVLGDHPASADDIERLPRLDQLLKEVMRLYPPVWLFARQAAEGGVLAGFPIPRGATVFASPWVSHRSARQYADPDEFRPERWAADRQRSLPRFAYLPFGGGPRACIGASFARVAMSIVLSSVLRRFSVELTSETDGTVDPTLTLRCKRGMKLRMKLRPGGHDAPASA